MCNGGCSRGAESGQGLRGEKLAQGSKRRTSEGHGGTEGQKLEVGASRGHLQEQRACHAAWHRAAHNNYMGEMICLHFMNGKIEPWKRHHEQMEWLGFEPWQP